MKKRFLFILFILSILSCQREADVSNIPYIPKIVVEGRIEEGGYASVLLSLSAPITGIKDTVSLLTHAIRSAKVTVSNGDTSELLYLRSNSNKIPPYEYRGKLIKGETEKKYFLNIEYDGNIITSETHIPASVDLDDIWFKRKKITETIGYIGVSFKNESKEYYQLASSPFSIKDVFTPCLYGNIDSRKYNKGEKIDIELKKGPTIYPKNDFTTFYNISDTIRIRLSTQPKEAYDFWNSYQNEILNAQNPIYPTFSSLKSNISGGIGIWSGYGSSEYIVILSEIEK